MSCRPGASHYFPILRRFGGGAKQRLAVSTSRTTLLYGGKIAALRGENTATKGSRVVRFCATESIWNSRGRSFIKFPTWGVRVSRRRERLGGWWQCDRGLKRVSRMQLLPYLHDPSNASSFPRFRYVPWATRWIIVVHPRYDRRVLLPRRYYIPRGISVQ